ncbi:MAG TPA: HAD-IB family hydrolase [Candidatus Wallbacteria bacterium]|nr:HAD-IB family hydrolase [Candidatus Wallbacteria bacterium]
MTTGANKNEKTKKRLILLDIDETLFTCDTFVELMKYYIYVEPKKLAFIPGIALCAIAFKAGMASNVEMKEKALSVFSGETRTRINALSRRFIEKLFSRSLNRAVYENIKRLTATGLYDIVIISASPSFYIDLIGEKICAFKTIATNVKFGASGVITSSLEGANCKGSEKIKRLEAEIRLSDYDLKNSYAFSDSITDSPMFDIVGRPVAVNPDRELLKTALLNKYAILYSRR